NHIHLLVHDDAASGANVIPRSIQLVAGRTGQEYNQRKRRKGAYWEDRYHATAVESGDHFLKCLVYIDLNMVRAGVVAHPNEWPHSGYNEIQSSRRKYVLIDSDRLMRLAGFSEYGPFREAHRNWVHAAISEGPSTIQPEWSKAIAVGGAAFVQKVKDRLRALAIGRYIASRPNNECYELKEAAESYKSHFDPKKDEIAYTNTYKWDKNMCVYG
ncbi:MAG: transposase, partial [Pseudomonadota bacterium]